MDLNLNLGCGKIHLPGWINVDKRLPCDVLLDLEDSLPFKANSFSEVKAEEVLEHVFNYPHLLDECWRVLKRGGRFLATVPHFPHPHSVVDPGHIRFFVQETFFYFTRGFGESKFSNPYKPWKILENVATESAIRVLMEPEK